MKHKIFFILFFILVLGAGVAIGVYIRNQTLNPRATIPSSLVKVFNTAIQEGEKEEDDLLYYDTDLSDFILNGSKKTKVAVVGVVDKIAKQPDGDYHVVMRDDSGKLFLVAEFIPEIKLSLPNIGQRIKIWGIVRLDVLHNWWEIHPVIGWEKV